MSPATKRLWFKLIWILAIYAGLVHVTRQTWRFAVRDYQLVDSPPLAKMTTKFIDLLTLGHRGLYDDLVTIWSLQALMDLRLKEVPPEEVQKTILTVTRHSPQIESLFSVSCYVMAYDFRRPDLCERIIIDGIKALPESWRIPMIQGFMYYGPLKNQRNASLYYGLAAAKEGSPPFLKKLATNLVKKNALDPDDLEALSRELLPQGILSRRYGNHLKTGEITPPTNER